MLKTIVKEQVSSQKPVSFVQMVPIIPRCDTFIHTSSNISILVALQCILYVYICIYIFFIRGSLP